MKASERIKEIENYLKWSKALYGRDEDVPIEFYELEIKYGGFDIKGYLLDRAKELTKALENAETDLCVAEKYEQAGVCRKAIEGVDE